MWKSSLVRCAVATLFLVTSSSIYPETIRIASITVGKTNQKKMDALVSFIRKLRPDVVAFQGLLREQIEALAEKLRPLRLEEVVYERILQSSSDVPLNPIFYNQEKLQYLSYDLTWLNANRSCSYANFLIRETNKPLWIFNAQFDGPGALFQFSVLLHTIEKIPHASFEPLFVTLDVDTARQQTLFAALPLNKCKNVAQAVENKAQGNRQIVLVQKTSAPTVTWHFERAATDEQPISKDEYHLPVVLDADFSAISPMVLADATDLGVQRNARSRDD